MVIRPRLPSCRHVYLTAYSALYTFDQVTERLYSQSQASTFSSLLLILFVFRNIQPIFFISRTSDRIFSWRPLETPTDNPVSSARLASVLRDVHPTSFRRTSSLAYCIFIEYMMKIHDCCQLSGRGAENAGQEKAGQENDRQKHRMNAVYRIMLWFTYLYSEKQPYSSVNKKAGYCQQNVRQR